MSSGPDNRGTEANESHAGSMKSISIYAIPLMRAGPHAEDIRYAYIPCQSSMPEASTSSSQKGFFSSLSRSVTTSMTHVWNQCGEARPKTWARWIYDQGQSVIEDVSPEGRLVKGIDPSSKSVRVFYPASLTKDRVHKELRGIIKSRTRSESFRLVAYTALLVPGIILDNTLLIAVPLPIGGGAAGYKAYSYLAGTRGSMHMSRMIKNHDKLSSEESGGQETVKDVAGAGAGAGAGARVSTSGYEQIAEEEIQDPQYGLRYVPLDSLSIFVSRFLDECGVGEMIGEDLMRSIVSVLPEAHRSEVERHLTELRRRHERQMQRKNKTPQAQELAVLQ